MTSVTVNIWSDSKSKFADVNVNEGSTVLDLKSKLIKGIREFKKKEVVIVQEKENGISTIVENNAKLSDVYTKDCVAVKAFPKKTKCVIKTSELYESKEIDVTSTVFEILYDVILEKPQYFVAGYQRQNEARDASIFYPCALSGKLCEQGWFHDTLFVVRRLYSEDLSQEVIGDKAKFLIENCRMANNLALSAYDVNIWGELSALQFLFERATQITESYVRQNITRCVSAAVKDGEESELIEKTIFFIRRHSKMNAESALKLYLITSLSEGCQCSYTERVKFKVVGSPWFSSSRYIYICPQQIWLTKCNGYNSSEKVRTADVTGTSFDGENVIITLINKVQWAIKCSRPIVLMKVINEIIKETYKDVVDRASKEKEIPRSDSSPNFLVENDEAISNFAPITQLTDQNNYDEPFNYSLSSIHPDRFKTSEFLLDPTYDPLSERKVTKRVRALRMKPKCLPKIKVPDVGQIDNDVDVKSESLMKISIKSSLDDITSIIEEENLVPKVEEFFEYTGKEGMTNNRALVFWIISAYLLISFARWLNRM